MTSAHVFSKMQSDAPAQPDIGDADSCAPGPDDPRWLPADSPFEHWFFKLNAVPLALLVDWVIRPDRPPHLRISVQSVAEPRVTWHEDTDRQVPTDGWIGIGGAALGPGHTSGQAGEVAWDLHYTCAVPALDPLHEMGPLARHALRLLSLPPMQIVSLPIVTFSGTLSYQGHTWTVEDAAGAVSHYWGAHLPEHWLWVNAAGDDPPHTAVEAVVVRTRAVNRFGPRVWLGYLWLWDKTTERAQSQLFVHPLHGHIDVRGTMDAPLLRAVPWHGTGILVRCRAHPKTWQRLGDEIVNTLAGDCRVVGGMYCFGKAGIEWRRPPVS